MTRSRENFAAFWHNIGKRIAISLILFAIAALLSTRFSIAKPRNAKLEADRELRNVRPSPSLVALEGTTRTRPPSPAPQAPEAPPADQQTPALQTPTPPTQPLTLVATPPQILQQGGQISLNGKTLPVPWMRWQEGNTEHFGISDTAAATRLGIELLSSTNPDRQPVRWFSEGSPILLKTLFRNPYRYLDLSNLTGSGNLQWSVAGETLVLTAQPAKIVNIREGKHAWGERYVVDLDRPTFWQATERREEASVALHGIADAALIQRLKQPPGKEKPGFRLPWGVNPLLAAAKALPLKIESSGSQTTLRFKLPEDKGLKVTTLPNRLIIDVTSEPFSDREIFWQPGVIWWQQQISVGNARFPVTALELNPRAGIGLRPIWSNLEGMTGIEPLVKTGRAWQAVAAINGGFFNRNTKQPLGVIRRDERWFSGPILNRGAIAWDDRGNIKIDRLRLQETAVTSTGQRLAIVYLNSGYVQ
ncbi:MAG: hypothetical protein SVX43_21400, partial [Cyanobacteriota bacterium]|nr:hypothetical protein [Cyanobacteriota bacterium]